MRKGAPVSHQKRKKKQEKCTPTLGGLGKKNNKVLATEQGRGLNPQGLPKYPRCLPERLQGRGGDRGTWPCQNGDGPWPVFRIANCSNQRFEVKLKKDKYPRGPPNSG